MKWKGKLGMKDGKSKRKIIIIFWWWNEKSLFYSTSNIKNIISFVK